MYRAHTRTLRMRGSFRTSRCILKPSLCLHPHSTCALQDGSFLGPWGCHPKMLSHTILYQAFCNYIHVKHNAASPGSFCRDRARQTVHIVAYFLLRRPSAVGMFSCFPVGVRCSPPCDNFMQSQNAFFSSGLASYYTRRLRMLHTSRKNCHKDESHGFWFVRVHLVVPLVRPPHHFHASRDFVSAACCRPRALAGLHSLGWALCQ